MARRALEDLLTGAGRKQKEPSIWERLQMEHEQKKKEDTDEKQQSAQNYKCRPVNAREVIYTVQRRNKLLQKIVMSGKINNRTTRISPLLVWVVANCVWY